MRRRQTPPTLTVLLVVTALILSTSILLAKPTSSRPTAVSSLANVGLYPTQVVATVKSLEKVKSCTGDASLCKDHTLLLIKLRIHRTKPLTLQGTVIDDGESLDVISRQPIAPASIGKTITAQIELHGDSTRERWLLTDIVLRSR